MCEGARASIPAEKEGKEEEEEEDGKRYSAWHSAIFNLKPIFSSSLIIQIDPDLNLVSCFNTELLRSLLASTWLCTPLCLMQAMIWD